MHGNYYHGAQEQNKEDRGRVSVTQHQQPPPQVNNKSVSPGLSSVQQRIKALEEQKRLEAEKQQATRAKTPTFQDRQATSPSPMQQSTTQTRQSQIQGQPQPVQAVVRPSQTQQPAQQIKQTTIVEVEKPVSINERIKALSKKTEMQVEEERQKQLKDQQVKERPSRTPGPSEAKVQERPSQVQQLAASFQRPSQLQKTENHTIQSQQVQHERTSEKNTHHDRPSQQIAQHQLERPSQQKTIPSQEPAQISPIQERISRLKQQEQQAQTPAPQPVHQQNETSPQPNNIKLLQQRWQQQQQQTVQPQPQPQPKPLPQKLPTHQFEQPKPTHHPTTHEHQQHHIQHQQTVQPTVTATQSVAIRPSITPDPRIEKTKLNSKFDPNFLMSLSMQVQHGALKPKTYGGEPTTSGTKIENVGPINVSYENLQKDQNQIANQLSGVLAKGRPQQSNNEGLMDQKSQMNHDLAEIMKQRNKRTVQNMEV